MITKKDLIPEIRAKIPTYKEKCTKDLYSGIEYENFNYDMTVGYIEKLYELVDRDKPIVIIAKDPSDYTKKFRILQNDEVSDKIITLYKEKNINPHKNIDINEIESCLKDCDVDRSISPKSHFLFLCSTYHRVYLTWFKFIQDEFKIEHKNKEILNWLYANANNNISRCYFTKAYVLVLRMPKYIKRNSIGFHNVDGYAVEWENYGIHYINGRKISSEIFNAVTNKTYTFDDFNTETNEDVKASIITLMSDKFGNQELCDFLDAEVVDEQKITHLSGHSEIVKIWKTKKTYEFLSDLNGKPNQPYAWLELKCPSSGSIYMIPTSPHFKDAIEACKFHRPQQIPNELRYDFQSFNN